MDNAASEKTINQQEDPASAEKSAKTDSTAESSALPEKQPEITSEKKEENKPAVSAEKTEPSSKNSSVPAAPKPASTTRTATLYFVSIGADGSVSRQAVKRQLAKSDSPLTDAIKALLAGPVPGEKNAMSLIPSGSRLIGASVKDGVATLNFNESFEFNSYGVEGSIGQLMQIVYTATEFSTVKSVQFLIEGEKKEYLGSEGQWIGTPLSRSSF